MDSVFRPSHPLLKAYILESEVPFPAAFKFRYIENSERLLHLKCQIHFEDQRNWPLAEFYLDQTTGQFTIWGPDSFEKSHDVDQIQSEWATLHGDGPVTVTETTENFWKSFVTFLADNARWFKASPKRYKSAFENWEYIFFVENHKHKLYQVIKNQLPRIIEIAQLPDHTQRLEALKELIRLEKDSSLKPIYSELNSEYQSLDDITFNFFEHELTARICKAT